VSADLDALIRRADGDDPAAVDELFSLLYSELHRLAEVALRRDGGAVTLGATTLLHEAYLNISARDQLAFEDRARFLAYASRAMRGLIIDYARRRRTQNRGRHLEITLTEAGSAAVETSPSADELIRLGEALQELSAVDPELAGVVDLHFFCGFSFSEIAAMRGVSERTAQRDWRKARMLLHEVLRDDMI
jgi:RNA polymerase sigma factor (TIGR02999 family)